VLTNSTLELPVQVSLERGIAEKLHLLAANTPTNVAYARLPSYLTERGTVGVPKNDINTAALLGTVAQGLSSLAGKNSGLVQGLGSALTGGAFNNSTNAAADTNQAGGKVGSLLQGLGGILGGKPAPGTNAPPGAATNSPSRTTTNSSPVGDLLNGLLGPKK
jgi:hypothetical protein